MSAGRLMRCAAFVFVTGLFVNAAITYALVVLIPLPQDSHPGSRGRAAAWRGVFPRSLPEPEEAFEAWNPAITHWQVSFQDDLPMRSGGMPVYVLNYWRVGIPLRCVEGWNVFTRADIRFTGPKQGWWADILWRSPKIMKTGRAYMSSMPLAPRWLGMLGNAAVYGLLALGGVVGIKGMVHARRRRRGLCPACAYPVGVAAVCSECGRASR